MECNEEWQDRTAELLYGHHISGHVYRLINANGEVFYIGQTTDLTGRMSTHKRTFGKVIARVEVMEVPLHLLRAMEAEQIHAVHPAQNRACPYSGCKYYADAAPPLPKLPSNSVSVILSRYAYSQQHRHAITTQELCDALRAADPAQYGARSDHSLACLIRDHGCATAVRWTEPSQPGRQLRGYTVDSLLGVS